VTEPGTPVDDLLIERALRGEASDAEVARLTAWRRERPEHEARYAQLARLVAAARALGAPGAAVPRPSAEEILRRVATAPARRVSVRRWLPWAVAAAATIVAVASLARRGTLVAPAWGAAEVSTGAGELATVQLQDGSVVRLAPSSRLRVAAGNDRDVSLEGRAFFAVQKVPGRPFRVHTRAGSARVLGTRFELATIGGELRLAVVEGSVALDAPRNRVEVKAGEETAVHDSTASRPTKLARPDTAVRWVGTFLVFQATPLGQAAKEIARVYDVRVSIADSTLAAETITATFTDRPLREVVDVVCAVIAARCEVRPEAVSIAR
jgi:transmembrane sensor